MKILLQFKKWIKNTYRGILPACEYYDCDGKMQYDKALSTKTKLVYKCDTCGKEWDQYKRCINNTKDWN